MVKQNIKPSKPKRFTTTKNVNFNKTPKQTQLGFTKQLRKDKTHDVKTPSKNSSLRPTNERDPKTNKTHVVKTPSKNSSFRPTSDRDPKIDKTHFVKTLSRNSSLRPTNERDPKIGKTHVVKTPFKLKISSLRSAKGNVSEYDKKNKKKFEGDLDEGVKVRPKKKKRVIRIDPFDVSNKRMDDGLVLNGVTNQKKEEDKGEVNKVELSKNAQFRAINPSPSMLSFVEENLLGRRRDIELRRAGYNIELSAPLDNIPFSTSTERERIEENIFRNKLEFFAAAKVSSSIPPLDLPEIAFAGRSNVGKSSLLNSLTRQWGVVRTSDKPGHTQSINFFRLGTKLCLVDLPGYGFAYAKEDVKEAWEELVKEYVSTRVGLKRVCLLVDTKWGMKPRDYELINLMERSQTKYQIVLTKTDSVFPLDVARRAMQVEEALKHNRSAIQPAMMVSSKSGAGIRSLRTVLSKLARFVKP